MTHRSIRNAAGALVALASLWPGAGGAADAEGLFVVEGPGRLSCAELAGEPDPATVARTAAWLSGYLSAHNQLLPETFDLTPWQTPATLLALVGQYCAANRDDSVSDAAQHLVRFLAPGRLTAREEAVSVPSGGASVVLYASVVAQARVALAEAGYPAGETLEALAGAVRAFQAAEGLSPTGLLDQATLGRLLL